MGPAGWSGEPVTQVTTHGRFISNPQGSNSQNPSKDIPLGRYTVNFNQPHACCAFSPQTDTAQTDNTVTIEFQRRAGAGRGVSHVSVIS